MTCTIAELAWLAGIIDGEGTVALTHAPNRNPHLRVQIYNSDQTIIDKVHAILAGCGVAVYMKWDERTSRRSAVFSVGTAGSITLHSLVRPYLVRQVGRYDAAVEFLKPRYEGRTRVRWTPALRAEWQGLRSRFNAT